MKKVIILSGLMASFLIIAGCASQAKQSQGMPTPNTTTDATTPVHHDYKGEVSGTQ